MTYEELIVEAQKLEREIAKDRECLDEKTPCTPQMGRKDPDLLCSACSARYFARHLVIRLQDWKDAKRNPKS